MNGFKSFLLRGNVVDLAVGLVVGAAFTSVINALVKDLITPLVAAVAGEPDFARMSFTIHNSRFLYGDFINAVLAFLIDAVIVYFLIVVPFTRLVSHFHHAEPPDPATRKCPECLSVIPDRARRCAFCTTELATLS